MEESTHGKIGIMMSHGYTAFVEPGDAEILSEYKRWHPRFRKKIVGDRVVLIVDAYCSYSMAGRQHEVGMKKVVRAIGSGVDPVIVKDGRSARRDLFCLMGRRK